MRSPYIVRTPLWHSVYQDQSHWSILCVWSETLQLHLAANLRTWTKEMAAKKPIAHCGMKNNYTSHSRPVRFHWVSKDVEEYLFFRWRWLWFSCFLLGQCRTTGLMKHSQILHDWIQSLLLICSEEKEKCKWLLKLEVRHWLISQLGRRDSKIHPILQYIIARLHYCHAAIHTVCR